MPENKFPVDIFAVKEYGIEKWQKEFFWPVSDSDFISLCDEVERLFADEIDRRNGVLKKLLIVQCRFLSTEYVNFLHALKVIDEAENRGMEILCSKYAWWYNNLLAGADNVDIHISRIAESVHDQTAFSKTVRSFIKSIAYNKSIFRYLRSVKDEENIKLIGSINSIIKQYLGTAPKWVHFSSQGDWLAKDAHYKLEQKLKDDICECAKMIIDKLCITADKRNVKLLDIHKRHLGQLTEEELLDTAKIFYLVKQKIKNQKKIHLLMSARGNPFFMTVGMAVQEYNGTVTNFAHGGEVGFLNTSMMLASSFDIPTVNTFVTYTADSAELYGRIKNNYSRGSSNGMNIVSGESDEHFISWQNNRFTLPNEIKRIMILGSAHHQWRKPIFAGLSLMRLDYELRLVDSLKRAGFEVIYKAHPNRISEIEGIFEDSVRVIKGRFADALDKADAYLFSRVTTSAFATAICTNKPVVLLDIHLNSDVFPEAMELLRKRCRIVSTKIDERNRINFNENELLEAVFRKTEEPNTEFIEKYMFPEKVKSKLYCRK